MERDEALSVSHPQAFPCDLGTSGLGGTPEMQKTWAKWLSKVNKGSHGQAWLSFQAHSSWFPDTLPSQYSTQTLVFPQAPPAPRGLPPGSCFSLCLESFALLHLVISFKSQLYSSTFSVKFSPSSSGDFPQAWFILSWHLANVVSVSTRLTPTVWAMWEQDPCCFHLGIPYNQQSVWLPKRLLRTNE